jgi:hypothetical protein
MAATSVARATSGVLLLADISGYTGFLQAVATAHRDDPIMFENVPEGYSLVSTLLDGIIERLVPPMTLSKLEGDAVFAFADDVDEVPRGAGMLACLTACYAAFRTQLDASERARTCDCGACSRGAGLDLKFIVHTGTYVVQSIGGGRELVGPQVVMAHRLLKNQGVAAVGQDGYALFTDAAITSLDIPDSGSVAMTETYEHYPPIDVRVFPMH